MVIHQGTKMIIVVWLHCETMYVVCSDPQNSPIHIDVDTIVQLLQNLKLSKAHATHSYLLLLG